MPFVEIVGWSLPQTVKSSEDYLQVNWERLTTAWRFEGWRYSGFFWCKPLQVLKCFYVCREKRRQDWVINGSSVKRLTMEESWGKLLNGWPKHWWLGIFFRLAQDRIHEAEWTKRKLENCNTKTVVWYKKMQMDMQALIFLYHITLIYLHLYVYQWMANVGMFVKSTPFILLDACLPPGGALPGPFGAWVALRSWRVGGPACHGMGTWIEHAGFQEIDWLKSNPSYDSMQEMWNVSLVCQSVYIWDIVVLNPICIIIYSL